jgi:benzoyl-CoA reductase/2-hydroxyglutaryl-CoA dehydratase subunit BcrC/BadD/HgdB
MWTELGLDLKRHDELMTVLGQFYGDIYLSQQNRPEGMAYFDFVITEVHGLRVKELQDHKAKGGKVVGTYCVYVPEELVIAAGGICVGLCSGTDFVAADAEVKLPRNLCPLIKSSLGFKESNLCPYFKSCDLVIGETTCDGKKKTWEVMAIDAPVYVMEVPQKSENRAHSLWRDEMERLKWRLEELSGVEITAENLAAATKVVNAKREALKRLYQIRKNPFPVISGKDALLISQIAFYDDPVRFTAMLEALCDELYKRIEDGVNVLPGAKRIVMTGTPMAIPNWKMHHILETNGAVVVCEEMCTGTRYFENTVPEGNGDLNSMLKTLAARYLKTPCACITPNTERLDNVARYAHEYEADGVIDYTLAFCQMYSIEHYLLKNRLASERIPLIHIETDYSMGDFGQLTTRVRAFLETLE